MSELFLRDSTLEMLDANTVVGRIAPFNEETTIVDVHPDTGKTTRFREVFLPGSFTRMINGFASRGWTNALALNIDHKQDLDHTIGYATSVEERDDGAWATFSLYDSPMLDKVKDMLRTSHRGLSVGFISKKRNTVGDLVQHLVVHVDHAAATPTPAYSGAFVASVRANDLSVVEDAPTPRLDAAMAILESLRAN